MEADILQTAVDTPQSPLLNFLNFLCTNFSVKVPCGVGRGVCEGGGAVSWFDNIHEWNVSFSQSALVFLIQSPLTYNSKKVWGFIL